MFLDPEDQIVSELDGQGAHRRGVGVGYETDAFVACDVALFAERIKRVDGFTSVRRVSRSD
ncbi:MAG TPA: hypothetical protein VGS22_15190 [Thermoanaerobaculia bacterium]|nr:hypothetical protein [Thermoanaerobaculia bacterium]